MFVPESDAPHQAMLASWVCKRGDVAAKKVTLHSHGKKKISQFVSNVRTILMLRFSCQPRLIYVCSPSLVLPAAIGLFGFPGARLIYHSQDWLSSRKHRVRSWVERWVVRRCGLVVWNEPFRAVAIQEICSLERTPFVLPTYLPRCHPLPGGTSSRQFGALDLDKLKRHWLVFAGGPYSETRMSPELCVAIQDLSDDVALIFTGDRPAIPNEAVPLGNTHFTGHLSHDDYLRLVGACDVGMLLYRPDDLGNLFQQPGRLTEYLRSGTPVVASKFPASEKIALDGKFLELVDNSTPREIGRALLAIRERAQTGIIERESTARYAANTMVFDHAAETLLRVIQQKIVDCVQNAQ